MGVMTSRRRAEAVVAIAMGEMDAQREAALRESVGGSHLRVSLGRCRGASRGWDPEGWRPDSDLGGMVLPTVLTLSGVLGGRALRKVFVRDAVPLGTPLCWTHLPEGWFSLGYHIPRGKVP